MKRAIVKAPDGITFDSLTVEQKAALESVFTQYTLPMPGTKSHGGYLIIDAVLKDNFDPATIDPLGLPFVLLGYWQWDGIGTLTEIIPIDSTFIDFIQDVVVYDFDYNLISTTSPTLHETHKIAGWPDAF
jgi:hypothetical protein